ncbi:MAG: efflux RND transporter periplasmic adaptor subunit [Gammaproteobacteria bacterium]|nr:efflux RND transporter periplasmic adaptor subunit [Gammaproteobacteria bacterium]
MDKDAVTAASQRQAAPWVIAGVIAVLITGAGLAWYFLRPIPITVRTAVVEAGSAAGAAPQAGPVLSASGYVVARRISTPSAKITAQVTAVYVEEGMSVREGDVLAVLDDTTPRAQLALAESQLIAARKGVSEFDVRLDEARRTLARNASLYEQKLISESLLDASRADVNALEAKLSLTRSQVEVALRSVDVAAQAVDDTIIKAPFSGVVVSKDAQPGEMISPISAGGGFTRTGICTLVDMDSLEIEVDVNEAYINRVGADQRVAATLDAYPDWRIPAHVISIVPTADRQKATVKVRIGFDAKDGRILPDMGIQVQFMDAPKEEGAAASWGPRLPWVSVQALVKQDDKDYVFVVHDDSVERRAVRLGPVLGGGARIEAGLQAGETVVLSPAPELADGNRVTIESESGKP